ncbi:Imm21 family immunity protein [Herbidospora sp. RD11066]
MTDTPLWIETMGGPLIAIPESACRHWQGGLENGEDYWRACAVSGYVGLIEVGTAQALVLGDVPALATFLPESRIFVRWLGADSAADIIDAATEAVESAQWEEELVWDVREPVILFDSVLGYDMIAEEEHLRVDLPPGRHTVRAATVETESVTAVVVRLDPVEQDGLQAVCKSSLAG